MLHSSRNCIAHKGKYDLMRNATDKPGCAQAYVFIFTFSCCIGHPIMRSYFNIFFLCRFPPQNWMKMKTEKVDRESKRSNNVITTKMNLLWIQWCSQSANEHNIILDEWNWTAFDHIANNGIYRFHDPSYQFNGPHSHTHKHGHTNGKLTKQQQQ